jgi:hypothetical protein
MGKRNSAANQTKRGRFGASRRAGKAASIY